MMMLRTESRHIQLHTGKLPSIVKRRYMMNQRIFPLFSLQSAIRLLISTSLVHQIGARRVCVKVMRAPWSKLAVPVCNLQMRSNQLPIEPFQQARVANTGDIEPIVVMDQKIVTLVMMILTIVTAMHAEGHGISRKERKDCSRGSSKTSAFADHRSKILPVVKDVRQLCHPRHILLEHILLLLARKTEFA